MQIDILTLFPESVDAMLNVSILGRAQERGYIAIRTHQIRASTPPTSRCRWTTTPTAADGAPSCRQTPCTAAGTYVVQTHGPGRTIFMSPCGRTFTQSVARELKAQL